MRYVKRRIAAQMGIAQVDALLAGSRLRVSQVPEVKIR
jgi:hypothetical protein